MSSLVFFRVRQDLNLCGHSPIDFKSISLTTRTLTHRGRSRIWTSDLSICSRLLCHWAIHPMHLLGLEPRTFALLVQRSNQLSYGCKYLTCLFSVGRSTPTDQGVKYFFLQDFDYFKLPAGLEPAALWLEVIRAVQLRHGSNSLSTNDYALYQTELNRDTRL